MKEVELLEKDGVVQDFNIMKSKGLGDTVAKITKATGIKAVVDKVTNGDCGCEERRDTLNRIFPYKR